MRCPTLTEEFSSSCGSKLCNCWECWCSYPKLHHCLGSSLCSDARWLQHEPSLLIHRLCFFLNDVKNSGPMFDCILSFLTLQLYMTSEAILRLSKASSMFPENLSLTQSDVRRERSLFRCLAVLQYSGLMIKCFFRYISKKIYIQIAVSNVQCLFALETFAYL